MEGETLVGLIELKDIKPLDQKKWPGILVRNIMQALDSNNTIPANLDAMEALAKLQKTKRSRVLVVSRENTLLGILTLKDMLDYFTMKRDFEQA
jgi:predicted transcriptional regulator